jgi:hypothetical protein
LARAEVAFPGVACGTLTPSTVEVNMPKGQEKPKTTNKPKLSIKEKQKKKKEKAAAK